MKLNFDWWSSRGASSLNKPVLAMLEVLDIQTRQFEKLYTGDVKQVMKKLREILESK